MKPAKPTTDALSATPPPPKRRRRWWLLVPFFILALIIPALISRQSDGLDFIRKHGPVHEELRSYSFDVSHGRATSFATFWNREFKFKAMTLDLLMDLQLDQDPRSASQWQTSRLPDGSIVTWDLEKSTVNVQLNQEPPWLVRQWHSLMDRFSPPPKQEAAKVFPHQ